MTNFKIVIYNTFKFLYISFAKTSKSLTSLWAKTYQMDASTWDFTSVSMDKSAFLGILHDFFASFRFIIFYRPLLQKKKDILIFYGACLMDYPTRTSFASLGLLLFHSPRTKVFSLALIESTIPFISPNNSFKFFNNF